MSIKSSLIEEFEDQIKEVRKMELGTEQSKIAIDGITKLADRIIEIENHEEEESDKELARLRDDAFKSEQLAIDKRDRFIRNCIEGVKVVGGLGIATWAFVASMHFERDGKLITTEGGRSALKQLLRFVK